jgi:hypothetical protein
MRGSEVEGKYMRRIIHASLALTVGFVAGVTLQTLTGALPTHHVPQTLFTNPQLTLQLMREFPIGADVLPVETSRAREQFEKQGWWQEPAVVTGYEAIKMQGEVIMLCQVRTQKGAGYTLSVNPSWIRRRSKSEADR